MQFLADIPTFLWWYTIIFILGIIALPLTTCLFSRFPDKGYGFSKIIGVLFTGFLVWFASSLHIAAFTHLTIYTSIVFFILLNLFLIKRKNTTSLLPSFSFLRQVLLKKKHRILLGLFVSEEVLFFLIFILWVYIRGHEPSIHGLEKFMDFGFINAILRSKYFPPHDMWLAPENTPSTYQGGFTINYYYFGHYITAFLTKLSHIPSYITYNLMLATLVAFSFVQTVSLGCVLAYTFYKSKKLTKAFFSGILSATILTFGGNLHTIYIFTKGYANESPVPFWFIFKNSLSLYSNYWYPNATRFIPNTIHEFPSYSWVVADLHGHVLDIPFVLLTLAVIFCTIQILSIKNIPRFTKYAFYVLLGFLSAVMYMTNAWDGLIYLCISILSVSIVSSLQKIKEKKQNVSYIVSQLIKQGAFPFVIIIVSFIIWSAPFSFYFVPFVHGIGVVGGYEFLQSLPLLSTFISSSSASSQTKQILSLGPFLFEQGNNLRSPFWMFLILWGFFLSCILFGIRIFILQSKEGNKSAYLSLFRLMLFSFFTAILIEVVSLWYRYQINGLSNTTVYSHTTTWWSLFFAFITLLIFIFFAIRFIFSEKNISFTYIYLVILIFSSIGLTVVPEFFYAKDIYPGHYRANTMFKLGYQAFIMLSIVSGFVITIGGSMLKSSFFKYHIKTKALYSVLLIELALVLIYPYFAISPYYGLFTFSSSAKRHYEGIDGIRWLSQNHTDDYKAIKWLSTNTIDEVSSPVILEAVGDSYTDYARISSFTGLPTVLGWPVHEWLWRGSYDEPGRRVELVRQFYEGVNLEKKKSFLDAFNISYIVVGSLEYEKYPNLNLDHIKMFADPVFTSYSTYIYKVRK